MTLLHEEDGQVAADYIGRVFQIGYTFNRQKRTYARVELTSATFTVTAFSPVSYERACVALVDGVPLRLRATVMSHPIHGPSLLSESWQVLPREEQMQRWAELLPSSCVANHALLLRLTSLVESVTAVPLREVLASVLTRVPVLVPYLQAPASPYSHHNWPGGLLEHSIEVAECVRSMPGLDETERELGVVAALLHDVGKTKTYDETGKLNRLGRLIRHEALTLETLACELELLEQSWEDAAIALRDTFTTFADKRALGTVVEQRLSRAVRYADAWSAASDKRRRAEAIVNMPGFAAFGAQRYWAAQPWRGARVLTEEQR
jgi:3'-5' exoribonuclease